MMENKAHALVAGLFVVVLAALLLGLGAWLTHDNGPRVRYEISTRDSVTGLAEQAPVRYRGVDVGKVTSIGFDRGRQGSVLVTLEVSPEAPVTTETFATLAFQGVTGLAFVQLDDSGQPGQPLAGGPGGVPRIPLHAGLVEQLTNKGNALLERVDQLGARMDQLLAESNQRKVVGAIDSIGQAAAQIAELSRTVNTTLNAQLGAGKVDLPSVVRKADAALASVRETSDAARAALGEVSVTARRLNAPDGPLDRLASGTEALSSAAERFNATTLPRVNRTAEDTSRAVRQLGRTVNTINDNPQSLIFGGGRIEPGPGEPGFQVPAPGARP